MSGSRSARTCSIIETDQATGDKGCACSKPRNAEKTWRLLCRRHNVIGMITVLLAFVSLLAFRLRGRASLKLELIALRHQLTVLRRHRPRHARLFAVGWLLWVWLYRISPQVLDAMVLVEPATVGQWHRKGLQIFALPGTPSAGAWFLRTPTWRSNYVVISMTYMFEVLFQLARQSYQ